jgi:uncharacterized membrane protein
MSDIPINVVTTPQEAVTAAINIAKDTVNNALNNNNNLSDNGNSGGLSRWLIWTIIGIVVVIVAGITVFVIRFINKKKRESGAIIKDIATGVAIESDKKVANKLLDVAIRTATDSAQLEANTKTATMLYEAGTATQQDVQKAVVASELSKALAEQRNVEAAKALEELRKNQLAQADAAVFKATQESANVSANYGKLSDDIIAQKIKEAQDVLREVTAKRQTADEEYNNTIALRRQAEENAQKRLDESSSQKQSIIAAANAKLRDIINKIKSSKDTAAQYGKQKATDATANEQPKPAPSIPPPAPGPVRCPPGFEPIPGGTTCRQIPQPPAPGPAPAPAPSSTVTLFGGTQRFPMNQGNYAGGGGNRGSITKPIPRDMEKSCLLEWDVFFPKGFFIGCQGKLGGLFLAPRGGTGRASGCADKKDRTGASYRIMFGKSPSVYQYFYFNNKTSQVGAMAQEERCGLGNMVDQFKNIKEGDWNSLKIGLKLNDAGQRNGLAYIYVNGQQATQNGIMWSPDPNNFVITSMSQSAFYGGCSNSPAKDHIPNTFLEMRNMRVSKWNA